MGIARNPLTFASVGRRCSRLPAGGAPSLTNETSFGECYCVKVTCESCGTSIPSRDVNLDHLVAKCVACDAVHALPIDRIRQVYVRSRVRERSYDVHVEDDRLARIKLLTVCAR